MLVNRPFREAASTLLTSMLWRRPCERQKRRPDSTPTGVEVLAVLPDLFIPPSGFSVTPVLAWWRTPTPVSVVDTAEVASVHRVPLAELTDPQRRCLVQHPSGFVGPAFEVRGLLVWGFTGGLLDRLIHLGGWEVPWDQVAPRAAARRPDESVIGEEGRR